MSNNVDRRIVEMEFDNKDFENNVQTSVKSLDKLKKSLNLEESAKGLSALEKAGHKFNLDGMVQAAEAVTSKFSILGTVGDQMLRRIGDAAFNALGKMKSFVDSLTIDPIKTGMQEYETQINAIQTILSNTRDDLSTRLKLDDAGRLDMVNEKLDQLNHYADKTIYNFTEMTRNIGTFTAAGVQLEVAVDSIQGIANLAAISGSTSEQASRAMYQLSQAISTGTVRLMDWNSVVNAGMGGKIFQDALVRTARAMGVTVDKTVTEVDKSGRKVTKVVKRTVDELIAEEGSFRESLSTGWLSADVLTATLEQFSWDFEQIAEDTVLDNEKRETLIQKLAEMYVGQGDDAEKALARAKAMIGDMSNLSVEAVKEIKKAELLASGYTLAEADEIIRLAQDATEAATKVKTFTQLFDTLKEAAQSGWTQTWEYIIGDFEEAKEMLTGISDFFGKIIDDSSSARNKIMKEWHDKGGRDMLWNNDEKKGPLGAFWNLVLGIKNLIGMVREEFQKIFPPATSQTLLNFTQRIQQATANFKAWTENSEGMDKIRRIVAGIAAAFDIAKTAIGYVWDGFKKLVGLSKPAAGGILEFAASIGDWLVKAKDSIKTSEGFQKFLQRIGSVITTVRGVVVSALKTVSTWISKLWGKVKSSGILTKIGQGISDFVGRIPDAIAKVKEWVKGIVEYVKTSDTLRKTWENVKKFFEPVLKGLGDFGKRLKEGLSSFFNKDVSGEESLWAKLKARLSAFGSAFSDWFGTVKTTVSNVWTNIKNFLTNFFTKTIPDFFNSNKVSTSGLIARIRSIDWVSVIKTAVGIYAGFKVLSSLGGLKSIGKGLKGIAGGLKEMGKGIKNVVKNGIEITHKNKDSLGNTLLKIAAAIGVLVASIYVLSKMETEDIVKGLGVISIIAVELLAISFLFGKIGADGKSFLMVAAALALLVIPIKLLGSMDTEQALKGILAIGVIMAELALFMRLAGKGFTGKTGFLGLAIAINLMVLAVKNMAKLDTGSMAKSLIGMEVLLLEMSHFMKKTSGLGKVGGLVAMAVAVNLLVFAVKRMGKMDSKTITKGVLGLGGIMTAFGLMAKMTKGMKLGSSIVMLLTMAGTMLIFIEAFKQVEGMNADNMLKFAVSLSATLLALSIAMKIISTIQVAGALQGLASFAILIVGIGGIVAALGWLQSEWKGMTDFLEGGGNVLGQIGRALGKFVGGIGAGIVEGLDLPQLGTDLSDFMTNAAGFIEGAKTIDGSVVTGVGQLSAALLAIGGTEFVNALVSLFTGENPVTKFSNDLKTLGTGLMGYANSIKGFSEAASADDMTSSVTAAEGLANTVSKLPSTGGILQEWMGWKDLTKFGSDIQLLAGGLKSYATAVKGFAELADDGDLEESVSTAQSLANLNNSLPTTGGKLQEWLGQKDLSLFSTQIVDLANGLLEYAKGVSGFAEAASEDDLAGASSTASALSTLNNSLPTTGGKLQEWLGQKDLSLFSTQIVELAEGLIKYATKISGFADLASAEDLSGASSTATALSDLNNSLPATGGILQDWLGAKDLSLFSTNIVRLANGLVQYATTVSGFTSLASEDDLASALAVAKNLADLNSSLPPTGGSLHTWLFGEQDLGLFATNIGLLGDGLKTFADSIGGVSYEKSEDALSVVDMVKEFTDKLDKTGGLGDMIEKFFNGSSENTLLSYTANMVTVGQNLNAFCESIKGVKSDDATETFAVLTTLTAFFDQMNKEDGGLWGSITTFFAGSKENTLLGYSETMITVGQNLKTFSDNIANVRYEESKDAIGIMDIVNEFIQSLGKEGGLWSDIDQFFGGKKDPIGLSEKMVTMSSNLATFATNLSGADFSNTESATQLMKDIESFISTLNTTGGVWSDIGEWFGGKKDIVGLSEKMASFGTNFSTFSAGITGAQQASTDFGYVKSVIEAFNSLAAAVENGELDTAGIERVAKSIGDSFVASVKGAIENGATDVGTAATTISDAGSTAAEATYNTWKTTGENLGKGLAAGIAAMAGRVKTAAINAAAGATRAIQITWSVHSPSRVGRDLGMNFDLGIAGGLQTYSKVVSSQAAEMGQSVVDSASTMLRGTDGSIFDNIDPNPTIRPVMDLTNIQNGVGAINGMFNSNRMVGQGLFRGMSFNKGVNALNFDGARIIGGRSNKDVVSELQSLAERFDGMNEAITNMQIVLDSGELVGATSGKMDNQLGTLAMRRGRGN